MSLTENNPSKAPRERRTPHSTEAEQDIIGSLLINNSLWDTIEGKIQPADFYDSRHRDIFEAIVHLTSNNAPFDYREVLQEMRATNKYQQNDEAYLRGIWEEASVLGERNIMKYVDSVRSKAIMRALLNASNETIGEVYDRAFEENISNELLETAQKRIFDIGENFKSNSNSEEFISFKSAIYETINYIQELQEVGSSVTGLSTGLQKLDELTAGLQAGDLIIVAARPSMGKTTFAMNMAAHAALDLDKTVLVFSLEMPRRAMMMRLFSASCEIPLGNIRTGKLTTYEFTQLKATIQMINNKNFFIDDDSTITVSEIRARARRLKRKRGDLSLIVVDYLQLIPSENSGRYQSRALEISEISRSLKLLAKELNVPIIALAQLNRELEKRGDRRPIMSDLKDSGAIEQDADVIMFVYRDEVYFDNPENKGKAEVIIGKQRNGELGRVKLKFQGQYVRFVDDPDANNVSPPSNNEGF